MTWKRERGQSLTEMALLLPILFLLLGAAFDMGRALVTYSNVVHAAREGAWVASQRPWDVGAAQEAVQQALQDAGLDPGLATITISVGKRGEPVVVSVSYPYTPLLPLPVDSITLKASHSMVRLG